MGDRDKLLYLALICIVLIFLAWMSRSHLSTNCFPIILERIGPITSPSNYTVQVKQFQVQAVNCANLFRNNPVEMSKALKYQADHPKQVLSPELYSSLASDCPRFRSERGYITSYITEEERDFPIAYSILMYKDIEQVERLLRAIYRPQNYYCIHVDKKSDEKLFQAVTAITACFDNVILCSRRIAVSWSTYTDLEPDVQCMEDLWKYSKWRYFINLTGQEFPLKTNLEIVQLLKQLNGTNFIQGSRDQKWVRRWTHSFHGCCSPIQPLKLKTPPPKGISPAKGSAHVLAQRGFVDFALHNQVAIEFRQWVQDTEYPCETFYSSLNHSPELDVPGAVQDNKVVVNEPRNKVWLDFPNTTCAGIYSRGICIFAVGDLPVLTSSHELFANKFHLDYHPLVLDCLEEWHINKTRDRTLGKQSLPIIR